MEVLGVNNVKISNKGNNLEFVSWNSVEQIILQHFKDSGIQVVICSGEIIIPPYHKRKEIIREFHESVVGGHKGVTKTYTRIRSTYYWENMKTDIHKVLSNCKTCMRNKVMRKGTRMPMVITDTPKQPFEKIQIDLVGPLPVTPRGNQYILTIQCVFTKYSDAIPLKMTDSVTIAQAIAENFISRCGCPKIIQTDQGKNLTSKVIENFFKIFKIKKIESTAYHPQSLGSLERSHHTLIEYLRHFEGPHNWDEWIRFAIFSYNTAVHEGTGFAPYTLVFGREAVIPSSFAERPPEKTYVDYLKDLFLKLDNIQANAQYRLQNAKEKSKIYYDQKVNPKHFKEGVPVYLKREIRHDKKFDPFFEGPYNIEKLLGTRNAQIKLGPNKTKIVHLDKLKLAATR